MLDYIFGYLHQKPKHINEISDDELLYAVAALMDWNHVITYEIAAREVGITVPFKDILEKGTLQIMLPPLVRQELRKAYRLCNK